MTLLLVLLRILIVAAILGWIGWQVVDAVQRSGAAAGLSAVLGGGSK